MGFFDKLKSAAQAVTGGAAKVTIEYQPQVVMAGDAVTVKISCTSTGAEVKSKGVFVDLRGLESVNVDKNEANTDHLVHTSKATFQQEFQIAPALTLGAGETKLFEGAISLPPTLQPSFQGHYTEHKWEIRGRLEAFGNDPDSGWLPIRVGLKG
jgi:sporulation-control protein spo0M